jgi:hypothetical protein
MDAYERRLRQGLEAAEAEVRKFKRMLANLIPQPMTWREAIEYFVEEFRGRQPIKEEMENLRAAFERRGESGVRSYVNDLKWGEY